MYKRAGREEGIQDSSLICVIFSFNIREILHLTRDKLLHKVPILSISSIQIKRHVGLIKCLSIYKAFKIMTTFLLLLLPPPTKISQKLCHTFF
ncbi:hypothetical protein Glove_423g68 [Diversispora epigaea]|uniref:Uncharacterized protein n=1 Tax=Diversispora epigaea TaxID=1348612 RepID=A0A397GZH0_9GLOM|nr:hypothetical protein Glove_423g68 [Diversispora epigaea]